MKEVAEGEGYENFDDKEDPSISDVLSEASQQLLHMRSPIPSGDRMTWLDGLASTVELESGGVISIINTENPLLNTLADNDIQERQDRVSSLGGPVGVEILLSPASNAFGEFHLSAEIG